MQGALPAANKSRPAWGAWIETLLGWPGSGVSMSRPAWGAWIETSGVPVDTSITKSRPAWGAWIETVHDWGKSKPLLVAPRVGRVD